MSKVSIIVAIYNTGKYLKPCLDSLVNQSFKDIELILIDDESSDGSEKICDEYAAYDNRIKVIHKKNEGISMARNTGKLHAISKYIVFIDGDDYVEKDMIKDLYENIIKYDADIVECGVSWIYDDKIINETTEEIVVCDNIQALDYMLENKKFMAVPWNKIYIKSLFDDIEYPRGCIHEDLGTTYKLLYKAKKLVCIPEIRYNYIQIGSSISHLKFDKRHLDAIIFLEEIYLFIEKLNNKILEQKAYRNLMLSLIYWYTRAKEDGVNDKEILEPIMDMFNRYYKDLKNKNLSIKHKAKIKAFKISPKIVLKVKLIMKK